MKLIKNIVIALLVFVIAIPVLGIGYMWASCNIKMADLDRQSSEIKRKIEQTKLPVSHSLKVQTNGDCLTGSGTSFSFTLNNPKGSPNSITREVVAELNNSGVPAPSNIGNPQYFYGRDGNRSGGGTPINQIYASYDLANNFDTYYFTYQLPEKIPCNFDADRNQVICNGVEQEKLLKQLLDTAQVTSIDVHGSVRKP